jgi:hypothetical protein
MDINKAVFKKLRALVDSIEDIEINGIEDIHQSYVRQIIKPFNKKYLYKEFIHDYDYVITKLSQKYTLYNNYALRSINEALEPIY